MEQEAKPLPSIQIKSEYISIPPQRIKNATKKKVLDRNMTVLPAASVKIRSRE